jgi:CAAX protease family protein
MLASEAVENIGVLQERLLYLAYGAVWFLLTFGIVQRNKLYKLPEERFKELPPNFLRYLIGAFLVFFFVELFIVPIYITLWLKFTGAKTLPPSIGGWVTIAAIVVAAIGVLLYLIFLPEATKKVIQGPQTNRVKAFVAGMMTWFFATPVVLIVSQVIAMILPLITKKALVDQSVVHHMKEMVKYPAIFWATSFGIVTFVPVVEEILFRGFLQTWLFDIFGRARSIVITSVIFAGFHFSLAQGISNIELLTSLFILSLFLGFIYEKQQSIFASIGLHCIFNLVGIIMIYFE